MKKMAWQSATPTFDIANHPAQPVMIKITRGDQTILTLPVVCDAIEFITAINVVINYRDSEKKDVIEMATIEDLFVQALAVMNTLTPDQLIHHRHEQRISFVLGNLKLSNSAATEESVREAAGPCACADCRKGKVEVNVYR